MKKVKSLAPSRRKCSKLSRFEYEKSETARDRLVLAAKHTPGLEGHKYRVSDREGNVASAEGTAIVAEGLK